MTYPVSFFGLRQRGSIQFQQLALNVGGGFPQVEAEVQRHLVVAAAAGVQPLARIAHAGGQGLLHEGVDILGVGVDFQRAAVQISSKMDAGPCGYRPHPARR